MIADAQRPCDELVGLTVQKQAEDVALARRESVQWTRARMSALLEDLHGAVGYVANDLRRQVCAALEDEEQRLHQDLLLGGLGDKSGGAVGDGASDDLWIFFAREHHDLRALEHFADTGEGREPVDSGHVQVQQDQIRCLRNKPQRIVQAFRLQEGDVRVQRGQDGKQSFPDYDVIVYQQNSQEALPHAPQPSGKGWLVEL